MILLKRLLFVTLLVVFFGCLLANVGTELNYAWYLPHSPRPESGRVFRVTINHGTRVYGPLFAVMSADFAVIGLWKVFGKNVWN
jgi:hypothetical protein